MFVDLNSLLHAGYCAFHSIWEREHSRHRC